jgi:uncharacterized protein (DUF1697 family)
MTRYVAFLRGVSPSNCNMSQLRACFAAVGFHDVRTVLSSGNVAFSTTDSPASVLEEQAEEALLAALGRPFPTMVRPAAYLQALVASEPFAQFHLPPTARCVVTFLRRAEDHRVELPVERDGARVLTQVGMEAFTAYEPNPRGPAFMTLLERVFGKDITTRTLATVAKCAAA